MFSLRPLVEAVASSSDEMLERLNNPACQGELFDAGLVLAERGFLDTYHVSGSGGTSEKLIFAMGSEAVNAPTFLEPS